MKTLFTFVLVFLFGTAFGQTILWKDSLSQAKVYFHIDSLEYDKHPHRTSKKYKDLKEVPLKFHSALLKTLTKALRKYPVSVLNENIDKIYIYNQFDKGGATMGTYIGRHGFFFAVPYLNDEEIDTFSFEKLIHHEFSHRLLMFNYKPFNLKEWKKNNDLKYGAIQSYDRRYDSTLYRKGFLHKYAVINKWEDFTSFAENIFMKDEEFWEVISQYEVLRRKFELTCSYYQALDPSMNMDYFLEMSNTKYLEKQTGQK